MIRMLRIVFGLTVGAACGLGMALGWLWWRGTSLLSATWQVPTAQIEVPWPAPEADAHEASEAVHIDVAADAMRVQDGSEGVVDEPPDATALAVERGRTLAVERLRCHACHGEDLGGALVADDPAFGVLAGPNLTQGVLQGDGAMEAFERIVRHGVRRDGTTALMPALDYEGLSDREVSDLFAYAKSFPEVERTVPLSEVGPVLRLLIGLGQYRLSAFDIDHQRTRPDVPDTHDTELERGRQLASACRGCHGHDFAGGLVPGADPTWPTASNLTLHPDGLADWTHADFARAMREGRSKDGRAIDPVMPWQDMSGWTDDELQVLFAYLQTVPHKPSAMVAGPPWRTFR
ncbi:MAG: c-type cytochrome [Myxococcales bacterium]|nr:c-type cytochrome [Myxococcales bacterium]